MTDVLEELSGDAPTRAHIQARVEDWAHRIDDLYAALGMWLPPGWTATTARHVRMFEAPMREASVPPRDLPVLDLVQGGQPAATIEPRGLWIIGTNGRLDLKHGADHYLIIDDAENFAPSHWTFAPLVDRTRRVRLDKAALRTLLAA